MRGLLGTERIASYRGLLVNRDYRRWFWSSLGSSFGDWVGLFALQVLVISLAEPGSRLALFGLGGIMLARLLPSVVFGPFAGVLSDRYDRKRLMLFSDVARAVLFVGIAFSRDLLVLFALTFVVECISLLYLAAKNAALPRIVRREQLTEANQLTLLVTYGPLPFGAAAAVVLEWLAGLLENMGVVDLEATTAALLFNALTFFIAGALIVRLTRISGSRAGQQRGPSVREELRDGMRFIRDRTYVRALIIGVVGVFFGGGVIVALGPEFVRSELGRPEADWYGLMTTVGAGLLLGILGVPFVISRVATAGLLPVTLVAGSVLVVVVATLPTWPLAMVAGLALGVVSGLALVTGFTLLHESTDDATRGKMFAVFYTVTRVAMFAALGLAPMLAGAVGRWPLGVGEAEVIVSGIRTIIAAGGLVALGCAVTAARGMLRAHRGQR